MKKGRRGRFVNDVQFVQAGESFSAARYINDDIERCAVHEIFGLGVDPRHGQVVLRSRRLGVRDSTASIVVWDFD